MNILVSACLLGVAGFRHFFCAAVHEGFIQFMEQGAVFQRLHGFVHLLKAVSGRVDHAGYGHVRFYILCLLAGRCVTSVHGAKRIHGGFVLHAFLIFCGKAGRRIEENRAAVLRDLTVLHRKNILSLRRCGKKFLTHLSYVFRRKR